MLSMASSIGNPIPNKKKSISKHVIHFNMESSAFPLQKIFLFYVTYGTYTASIAYFCASGVGVLTMSSSVLGSYVAVVSISTALLPAMIGYIFGDSN